MLDLLFATLQWSLIAGIWVFTAAGFYRSYKEIARLYRRANVQSRVSELRGASEQTEPVEWLAAA